MAANTIKNIGKFSLDAIHSLIEKNPLSEGTVQELEALENSLIKPTKDIKHARVGKLSDRERFTQHIEPAIREAARDFNAKGNDKKVKN